MIFAPTAGSYGFQVHGSICRMKNAESSAALVVGDLVVTNVGNTSYTFPGTNDSQLAASPFANVVKAAGNDALHNGFIGVVVDVGQLAGAAGTEVFVQFGGTAIAKVAATSAVVRGSRLLVSDTAGQLDPATASATGTNIAAIALAPLASGTSTIHVLLNPGMWSSTFI